MRIGRVGLRLWARTPGVSAFLVVLGLVLAGASAAGVVDITKHGRRQIGPGVVYGRYTRVLCAGQGANACEYVHRVHVGIIRAKVALTLDSVDLYNLVGSDDRRLPVTLEEDTFSHDLSRVRYHGQWYVIASPNTWSLVIVIPLAVLGLALVLLNLPLTLIALGRRITARRTAWRWVLIVVGAVVTVFCVALAVVGLSADRYEVGNGQIYAPYAKYDSTGYHEAVHLKIPSDGTNTTVESSDLYDIAAANGPTVAVQDVNEDGAGKPSSLTYNGRSYDLGRAEWLALFVVVPIGLLALALVVLNGRALFKSRRATAATAGIGI
jgi:hypothetical protein